MLSVILVVALNLTFSIAQATAWNHAETWIFSLSTGSWNEVETWSFTLNATLEWHIVESWSFNLFALNTSQPRFGKWDITDLTGTFGIETKFASKFYLDEDANITKIYWYGARTSANADTKAVIYSDFDGGPHALLGVSQEVTVSNTDGEWITYNFTEPISVSHGYYWLGIHSNEYVKYWFDSVATNQLAYNNDIYSDGASDPFGIVNYYVRNMTVYATYNPLGTQWHFVESWNFTIHSMAQWNIVESWNFTLGSAFVWHHVETWSFTLTPPAFIFHGLFDEATGCLKPPSERAVNVTAYFSDGSETETFEVNGTYYFYSASHPLYFRFELGATSNNIVSQYGLNFMVYNQSSYYDVVFSKYEDDTDYTVDISLTWNSTYTITDKTTTGFRVNFDTIPSANGYLNWYVYRTVTQEGTQSREYWVRPDEKGGNIYIFDQTLTTYTISFLDLAGVLADHPFVEAKRYINGTLMTVEKRKVDVENKIVMSLVNGVKYTVTLQDGASYTFGDLLMTSQTTIQLTLKGIEFPKKTLLTYKYVRIYGLRVFEMPTGKITITYQDTLNMTTSVKIYINYKNGTNIYTYTETTNSFNHEWSNALNNTDYAVVCTIDHARYGVYNWKQYFPLHLSTMPWSLDWLGTSLPFNTAYLIPALLILFVGGCFSVINAEVGAFMMVVVAIIIAYMGWLPIPSSALVVAFTLALLMGIIYAKRKVLT